MDYGVAEAFLKKGKWFITRGEHDKAVSLLKEALLIDNELKEAYLYLGISCDDLGNYGLAILSYKRSFELDPNDCDNHVNIGFLYLKTGNLKESESFLEKAIKLGQIAFGNMNLGHVHLAKGEEAKALACYQKSLAAFDNKDKFWEGMRDDYQYLQQYGIQKEDYEALLSQLEGYQPPK